MEYITTVERHGFEKGLEKGRESVLEVLELLLESKFERPSRTIVRKIRALKDLDELRQFARFLKSASSLDNVRTYLEN